MGNLAIIPARGGSKRILRKNCKDFLGKPIIAYSIEMALQSKLFDEVMVSTDDSEIAEIALKYGAKVPFMRSAENSNDFATTVDVIWEVLSSYLEKIGKTFDNVCCIYPTAPLIQLDDIIKGLDLLQKGSFDTVFPITAFSFPIQRSLVMKDGKTYFAQPEYTNTRSQDLQPHYHDAGQWYWLNYQRFIDTKRLITENTSSIILNEIAVQDIDNESDWKLAELKYELLQNLR